MKKIYISYPHRTLHEGMLHELKYELDHLGFEFINKRTNRDWEMWESNSSTHLIDKSDVFLFVYTGKNSSQFIELGYAMALSKKILIVADQDVEIPSDLRHMIYLRLDLNTSEFIYAISKALRDFKIDERREAERISTLPELISASLNNERILDTISPNDFEMMVVEYFRSIGLQVETAANRDYGYDFILMGFENYNRTIVEVKKYNQNSKVSVNTIHQVFGTLNIYDADHAIIITTSDFTSSAKDFVHKMDNKLELWNFETLFEKVNATHNIR